MGSISSHTLDVSKNEYVKRFASTESIGASDIFWHGFLGFTESFTNSLAFNRNRMSEIELSLLPVMAELRKNGLKSHNFCVLLQVLISEATNLVGYMQQSDTINKEQALRTRNALVIFRIISKYLLEHASEKNFLKYFSDASVEGATPGHLLDYIYQLLFSIIIDVPTSNESYPILCEAVASALILLSGQLHCKLSSTAPIVHQCVMGGKSSSRAPLLVHRLLRNFAENHPCPSTLLSDKTGASGVLWRAASSLASGLFTVVTLGLARSSGAQDTAPENSSIHHSGGTRTDLITSESGSVVEQECQLLANLSCLLLLVLTTQGGGTANSQKSSARNPYREALFAVRNEHSEAANGSENQNATVHGPTGGNRPQPGSASSVSTTNHAPEAIRINFDALCRVAASTLSQDSTTLLLYLMLHRNPAFQQYLLQNQNYRSLILPLLTVLHRSPGDNSHLVYMTLIVILILSENENFTRDIHSMQIKSVQWAGNRQLCDISIGSLLILVLTRTIQHHLNQLKDKYLHVNILAALANLSSKVSHLHPHVGETFVGLLHLLAKRHARTVEQIRLAAITEREKPRASTPNLGGPDVGVSNSSGAQMDLLGGAQQSTLTEEILLQDLTLLEEVIRMLLEILNSALSHALTVNPNLVYALLYRRDSFSSLRTHPSFQGVMQNIDTVLTFFSSRIEKELGPQPTHPNAVMQVVEKHAANFKRHCSLKKFPDLKFKYVEEESPDDFFIPYVWSVVLRQSCIPFKSDSLLLFASTATSTIGETETENGAVEKSPSGPSVAV